MRKRFVNLEYVAHSFPHFLFGYRHCAAHCEHVDNPAFISILIESVHVIEPFDSVYTVSVGLNPEHLCFGYFPNKGTSDFLHIFHDPLCYFMAQFL